MNEQVSFIDFDVQADADSAKPKIKVVKAAFSNVIDSDWRELFTGFDELYAITFSAGIRFVNEVIDQFRYAEIIFGCENIVSSDISTIMAAQIKSIQSFVKTKSAKKMAERLEDQSLELFVSRDSKSHEKVFILKGENGRRRVITGSANMSASAFCGLQRENIVCFDDESAFEYYKDLFDDFKDHCANTVTSKMIYGSFGDNDFLLDHPEEIPIIKTVENGKIIVLDQEDDDEAEIVADITGLAQEMKPMLPKMSNIDGKIYVVGEVTKAFRRKYKEHREVEKIKRRQLPKLHIDYETGKLSFNGKPYDMNPTPDAVASDVSCLLNYFSSFTCFYGNVEQTQKDYYSFLNWYFCSPFMPYLRNVAFHNNYDVTPFPVVGIIYGESNGGKSTFIRLLTKLMTGHKIPLNSSNDFTSTRIEDLKRACEGLPINIDDLAKSQFTNNCEKVIKDDEWGIREGFLNYPSIAVTTNKLASLTSDISKRTVTCYIDAKIDKEAGARNSKRVNESMRAASTALYSEYMRRMLAEVLAMEDKMKAAEGEYFPDVFAVSSRILRSIITEHEANIPEYITELSYSDYFGDKAVGRKAIQKILTAFKNEPHQFKVDRRNNTLMYSYPENGRMYELLYLQQELPPALNVRLTSKSIIMDYDQAKQYFGISFRKRLLS